MSTGAQLRYVDAVEVARAASEALKPVVARSKVVGSLRRHKAMVSDIEILVEPRPGVGDLFGGESHDVESIKAVARTWGELTLNGDRLIQIADAFGRPGLKLELYIVRPPANWFALLAIRTGPADLGKLCVTRLPMFQIYQRDGRIVDAQGKDVPVQSEQEWFALARMQYFPPHLRDTREAFTPLRPSPEAVNLLREACTDD